MGEIKWVSCNISACQEQVMMTPTKETQIESWEIASDRHKNGRYYVFKQGKVLPLRHFI